MNLSAEVKWVWLPSIYNWIWLWNQLHVITYSNTCLFKKTNLRGEKKMQLLELVIDMKKSKKFKILNGKKNTFWINMKFPRTEDMKKLPICSLLIWNKDDSWNCLSKCPSQCCQWTVYKKIHAGIYTGRTPINLCTWITNKNADIAFFIRQQ